MLHNAVNFIYQDAKLAQVPMDLINLKMSLYLVYSVRLYLHSFAFMQIGFIVFSSQLFLNWSNIKRNEI